MSGKTTDQPTPEASQAPQPAEVDPWEPYDELIPNLDGLLTEDGKPVDNSYVEKLYKLLTEPLFVSWQPPGLQGRRYLAVANVGWFHTSGAPPVVPDVMLSVDVVPRDPSTRAGRSYFQWVLGKPPDVVIEVVSDLRGEEDGEKMHLYARLGLAYYVIYDPSDRLGGGVLRGFERRGGHYSALDPLWIEELNLGLTLWQGRYLDMPATWLRWCDRHASVLPTGAETAAEQRRRADDAEERIRRLHAQLRALGHEPEV